MTTTTRAFVLSGGGARGALQVGALRALQEAGIHPDLLVGTSIGAVNAAYVAMHGYSADTLSQLEQAWQRAARADLLPANYLWLTIRMLFNRHGTEVEQRIRTYFIGEGLHPDLQFGQLNGPRLILVATDLEQGGTQLYGREPDDLVLSGVLASTAIPPWIRPLEHDSHLLMDGGLICNLPIEPALAAGATEIIALDLADPRPIGPTAGGWGPFLFQLRHTMQQRQTHVEMQLAAARNVMVHHNELQSGSPLGVWEFPHCLSLLEQGHTLAESYLTEHPDVGRDLDRQPRSLWHRAWQALTSGKAL